jgi:DNA-binding MarR family transcriptional regulator
MEGWVCLYRKILENPIICKDSDYFAVWCYLLLSATHKKTSALFKGKKIVLLPGQLITGRKSIAKKFKIDESKVQRILKTLENEQQIEQQTSSQNRLITIINWYQYQEIEQQNAQQVNNECTTSEQRVNTNNNETNNIYNNILYTREQIEEAMFGKRFD